MSERKSENIKHHIHIVVNQDPPDCIPIILVTAGLKSLSLDTFGLEDSPSMVCRNEWKLLLPSPHLRISQSYHHPLFPFLILFSPSLNFKKEIQDIISDH